MVSSSLVGEAPLDLIDVGGQRSVGKTLGDDQRRAKTWVDEDNEGTAWSPLVCSTGWLVALDLTGEMTQWFISGWRGKRRRQWAPSGAGDSGRRQR